MFSYSRSCSSYSLQKQANFSLWALLNHCLFYRDLFYVIVGELSHKLCVATIDFKLDERFQENMIELSVLFFFLFSYILKLPLSHGNLAQSLSPQVCDLQPLWFLPNPLFIYPVHRDRHAMQENLTVVLSLVPWQRLTERDKRQCLGNCRIFPYCSHF